MAGTEIARLDDAKARTMFPALLGEDSEGGGALAEILRDNMGDDGLSVSDLPLIKIPTGGITSFTIDEEEDIQAKTLRGVIVLWGTGRVYYEKSFDERSADDEGGGAPDCSSADGRIGIGEFGRGSDRNPSGMCEGCPMNEWASARQGKGKACNEQKQVWMLLEPREGEEAPLFPTQIRLSPGSLAAFKKYRTALTMKRLPYFGVVTEISLEKVKNDRKTDYARAVLKRGERLNPETAAAARRFGEMVEEMLRQNPQVMSDGASDGQTVTGTPGGGPRRGGGDPTADDPWANEGAEEPMFDDEVPAGS